MKKAGGVCVDAAGDGASALPVRVSAADDVALTHELSKAVELLDVRLLDHLIVTKGGFARVANSLSNPHS